MTITLPGGGSGGSGGGGSAAGPGVLIATSSNLNTTALSVGIYYSVTWTIATSAPAGFSQSGAYLQCPPFAPEGVWGLWWVFEVGGVKVAEAPTLWNYDDTRNPVLVTNHTPTRRLSISETISGSNKRYGITSEGYGQGSNTRCKVYTAI